MKKKSDPKLEKLMTALSSIEKPELDDFRKGQIRNNILNQTVNKAEDRILSSNLAVLSYIRRLVNDLSLPLFDKVSVKERVFEVIEESRQKSFFWYRLFAFNKRFVSTALLFFMVFGMFSFVSVDTNVVRAATFTTLSSFEGEVTIERDGQLIIPEVGMQLYEDDHISTGDGELVIEYFDDSVSRLANNTELVINRLWVDRGSRASTYVEVSVVDGTMWSKVLNLVEDDSFFVVVANDVYTKAKRGAFNVALDEGEVAVEVYSHDVQVQSSSETEVKKVLSGNKVIVYEESQLEMEIDEESDWAKENMEEDIAYVDQVMDRLLASKMETLELDFEDDYSFKKSLREESLLLVTIDDVKAKQIELDLAEKNFLAAEVMLHDPDLTEEKKLEYEAVLKEFFAEVADFHELIAEVAIKDPAYATELDDYVADKLVTLKKDLALVLPDSPAYEAKKVVDELELLAAQNEEELIEKKAEQTMGKLADAEDLIVKGNTELADALIEEIDVELEAQEEPETQVEVELVEKEDETWTHYGVEIYGDKPLSPLLGDVD